MDGIGFSSDDTRSKVFPDLFDDKKLPAWRAKEVGSTHFHRATPCTGCGSHEFVRYPDRTRQDLRDKVRCYGCKLDEKRANRATYQFHKAQYRAAKMNATPKWLSSKHKEEILEMYRESQRMEEATGIKHQVDHIIPLQHQSVQGLHVPWNLRVIPASKNASKCNRFDPNDDEQSGKAEVMRRHG